MPVEPTKSNTTLANSLYECSNTGQLTNNYYACLNYPIKSTLTRAINRGYLKGWRGLTSQQTRCHISVSTESKMGHMDQQCQGVQSTQPTPKTVPLQIPNIFDNPMEDAPQDSHNTCMHFVFMVIYKINGNLFTNQTGHFPITSNRGHAYVVVFYIFNANAIQSVPIKNCSKEELLCAYCKIYKWLTLRGFKPLLHKLDNKTSKDVETFVATENTRIQYTPPDIHRIGKHSHPVHSPRHPLHKPCQTSRTHLEESFSCWHGRPPKILPHCQLVPPDNAMKCHTQHAMSVSSKSSPLGI
jgi:hypothetical protein